jgi:hypothetical protein
MSKGTASAYGPYPGFKAWEGQVAVHGVQAGAGSRIVRSMYSQLGLIAVRTGARRLEVLGHQDLWPPKCVRGTERQRGPVRQTRAPGGFDTGRVGSRMVLISALSRRHHIRLDVGAILGYICSLGDSGLDLPSQPRQQGIAAAISHGRIQEVYEHAAEVLHVETGPHEIGPCAPHCSAW